MAAQVQVSGLRVVATDARGVDTTLVHDVGFRAAAGEVVALIGESGSGKSTTALALMGYARPGCRIAAGDIRVGDTDVRALDERALRALRGRRVAYVAQSAAAAFNPARTLLQQVIESPLLHGQMDRTAATRRARELFAVLALPDPERIGARYPHEVSGGQLQRALAAMALIGSPEVVIFDEPTTALDVTTQIEVLRAFRAALHATGATAIYVSHDLAVVAQMADRIVVLHQGRVREDAACDALLARPQDAYTQGLLAAARPRPAASAAAMGERTTAPSSGQSAAAAPLLRLRGVSAGYGAGHGAAQSRRVLHDIDLEVPRGAAIGVIGESGSGKSTLARVIAGLVPVAAGEVCFDGTPLPATLERRTREQFRRIQIVFQNADTALNPAQTVQQVLARPLRFYHDLARSAQDARIARLLDQVRLPAQLRTRACSDLSGGQKQRLNLARALAAEPELLLCDEVTSALDTVVGAAILELIAELRRELGLACVFISHDLHTVRALCERVLVLYAGRRVEWTDASRLSESPAHPYSRLLRDSVPALRPGWLDARAATLAANAESARQSAARSARLTVGPAGAATAPAAAMTPGLCAFLDRCGDRIDGVCECAPPPLRADDHGWQVLCHRDDAFTRDHGFGHDAASTAQRGVGDSSP